MKSENIIRSELYLVKYDVNETQGWFLIYYTGRSSRVLMIKIDFNFNFHHKSQTSQDDAMKNKTKQKPKAKKEQTNIQILPSG